MENKSALKVLEALNRLEDYKKEDEDLQLIIEDVIEILERDGE